MGSPYVRLFKEGYTVGLSGWNLYILRNGSGLTPSSDSVPKAESVPYELKVEKGEGRMEGVLSTRVCSGVPKRVISRSPSVIFSSPQP